MCRLLSLNLPTLIKEMGSREAFLSSLTGFSFFFICRSTIDDRKGFLF
jgi:hypothetical protein